jgi:hypothetical protein
MTLRAFQSLRGPAVWLLAISQLTFTVGCRQSYVSSSGGGSASSTAPGSTAGPNIGEILYGVIHTQLQNGGNQAEVAAFEQDHVEFVTAMNEVLPTSVSQNLWPLIQKILPLVDDGTIPAGVSDVEGMMKDLLASQSTIAAMADMASFQGKSTLDTKGVMRLVSRLLAYPQLDDLAHATNDLIKNQPDLLKNIESLLSREMQGMTPATFQGNGLGLQSLGSTLLAPADVAGLGSNTLGAPAWAVTSDKNGNPAVTVDPSTGKVVPPFVDDGSGVAAVDQNGKPVDATGNAITLTPFGTDGPRDSYGRALGANGLTVFQYVDAKQTLLGVALYFVGQLLQENVPTDMVTAMNAMIPRVQHADPNDPWSGFGPQNPLIDMADSSFELVRRAPVHELLEGLAQLVKQDPAKFTSMVTSLVLGVQLAQQSGFSTAGQSNMINDLLPLLTDACKPQGQSVSAVRALLESFNSAQAQLHNLPAGFAIMMEYSDYKNKVPTDANHISAMEKLLDIMQASAGCTLPIIGGNLADMYLDAMAGNGKPILGITIDVHTMNSLINIPILKQLLCSNIPDSDVNALQDFADSGTLDAFIPIAKAFSDRGETHLLTEIMLQLQSTYATAMRPNEPAIVKLLQSGAVEKLFDGINQMTQVQVVSNGEMLIDVLADTVGALVDDSNPITDREGRVQKTLFNLLLQPMSDLSAAAQNAGVQQTLSGALSHVMNTLLATYTDANGNTQLVYNVFVNTLGGTLDFISQQIPADATQKSSWCDQQEQSVSDLMQSRGLAALVDVFLQIQSSTNASVFMSAIVNLFTPNTDPNQDVFGSIVQLLAGLVQVQPTTPISTQQAQDLAAVVNFVGQEIDPAAGKLTNMMTMIEKIVATDDGLLFLGIARNMVNVGSSGNQDPPIMTLMNVLSDVRNAAGSTGGGMSAQDLTNLLNKAIAFMDDQQNGLPHLFAMVKARNGN